MGEIVLKLKMLWLYLPAIREWHRDVWTRDWSASMCCSGWECGCMGADYGSWWEYLWRTRK